MSLVCARWVPRLLKDHKKRIEEFQKILRRYKIEGRAFLDRINIVIIMTTKVNICLCNGKSQNHRRLKKPECEIHVSSIRLSYFLKFLWNNFEPYGT